MIGDEVYRGIWRSLGPYFKRVEEILKREYPDACTHGTWRSSKQLPFNGYLSVLANSDPSRLEDCVLSMEIWHSHGEYLVKSDIASGRGEILAGGPSFKISDTETDDKISLFLTQAEQAVEEFFTENFEEVRRSLIAAE